MITNKQRSFLRSLAHNLEPTVFVGKSGLTETIIRSIEENLAARELVKVKIQDSCNLGAQDMANQIAGHLDAEFVQAIGRKFTLYRPSKENKKIQLPASTR